ncbi:Rieske (2Fe-2S) protein [Streptomyces sp. TP-A0356]|uniref:Rieske (2Fe-2S) protein n=1 Tax=Streptomyces sp. TP-A0356 TaxID=1359208 RepID=UPI0006E343EA|nr:Rieske (2Fe-2S) protein [Streptomyces sp. TP-A0356]
MTIRTTRRTLLVTSAAVLVAGCGNGGKGGKSSSSMTASVSGSRPASASGSPSTTASGSPSGGHELARTREIPVGGGKIFKQQKVVVTQPTKGDFKAFSAICTHEGCTVGTVADGTIDCPCHGSRFRIADASVAHGPATRPLPPKKITVEGDTIRLA